MTRTLKFVNGDVVRSSASAALVFVSGRDKARQAIQRMLNVDAGLERIQGQDFDSDAALSAQVQRNIRTGFAALIAAQSAGQLAQRTPEERLAAITRLFVTPTAQGGGTTKTGFAFTLDALTVSGAQIQAGTRGA